MGTDPKVVLLRLPVPNEPSVTFTVKIALMQYYSPSCKGKTAVAYPYI